MYFIILGDESVPTSKIGHSDTVALRQGMSHNKYEILGFVTYGITVNDLA